MSSEVSQSDLSSHVELRRNTYTQSPSSANDTPFTLLAFWPGPPAWSTLLAFPSCLSHPGVSGERKDLRRRFVHLLVVTRATQGWTFPDVLNNKIFERKNEQSKGCCAALYWLKKHRIHSGRTEEMTWDQSLFYTTCTINMENYTERRQQYSLSKECNVGFDPTHWFKYSKHPNAV